MQGKKGKKGGKKGKGKKVGDYFLETIFVQIDES